MQSTKWELYEYQRSRSVIDLGPNHLHSIFLNFFSSVSAEFNISSAIRWAIQDHWSSGFIYKTFELYSLRNATESLTACCSDSYGTPYLCYFQCVWSLEGSCDKQNLTFVVSLYEIYETHLIPVCCSPKARKILKLHNSFHKFHIKWPLM